MAYCPRKRGLRAETVKHEGIWSLDVGYPILCGLLMSVVGVWLSQVRMCLSHRGHRPSDASVAPHISRGLMGRCSGVRVKVNPRP